MAKALRPIEHESRLSLVEHLDELRSRLIVSLGALVVAFGVCFWQNHLLLKLLQRPVTKVLNSQAKKGEGLEGAASQSGQALLKIASDVSGFAKTVAAPGSGVSDSVRKAAASLVPALHAAIANVHPGNGEKLVTLGVGEPFMQTVTISAYFAVLLALPVLLFQIYAFVLPAFSPREKAVALPVMLGVPFLLLGGVAFGYFVVLPAATHFLLNFNAGQFDVIVQASSYFPYAALILVAMGAIFQLPILLIALTRAQIVTTRQLRKNRRIAVAVAAAIAALLPGDAITMVLETVPIVVLYEISIHISAILDLRDRRRARANSATVATPAMATPSAPPPPRPLGDDDAV
ncbi:MAG: twin-arginine translocase subunit TatC [Solirubrobacteraceae bacterium]|jgi:sec-independent protein translocase protein TatC